MAAIKSDGHLVGERREDEQPSALNEAHKQVSVMKSGGSYHPFEVPETRRASYA